MKRPFLFGAILLSIVGCLTGCSSSTSVDAIGSSNYSASDGAMKASYMEESVNYTDYSTDYSSSEADIVKNTMMIVRDASLSLDVKNLEEFDEDLHSKVEEFGGYFEDATVNDYSSSYSTDRYAYYTVRLPQEKLDEFLNIIDGTSTITSKSVTSEDVSLEYVDINAHIDALENEKDNLNRLLEQSENVSDIIEIEDRLSNVQYQLDSVNGRKRLLEGRVSYSTININVHEERNVEHPIAMAFEINFTEQLVEGIENAVSVFVGILTSIPVIVIITAFVLLFIWVIRKIWRKIFKKDTYIRYMFVPVGYSEGDEIQNKGEGKTYKNAE